MLEMFARIIRGAISTTRSVQSSDFQTRYAGFGVSLVRWVD